MEHYVSFKGLFSFISYNVIMFFSNHRKNKYYICNKNTLVIKRRQYWDNEKRKAIRLQKVLEEKYPKNYKIIASWKNIKITLFAHWFQAL